MRPRPPAQAPPADRSRDARIESVGAFPVAQECAFRARGEASLVGGDERSLGRNDRPAARGETTGSQGGTISMNDSPHSWRPERFMVIAGHPDDADFGPAGTAARWLGEGSIGWLVCCTSGDAGGEDPDADPLELAALREREQRAAADVIGYAGVSFLHMPDGALVNDLALREQLVREIRTFPPDAVLATDPTVIFYRDGGIHHVDHCEARSAARQPG